MCSGISWNEYFYLISLLVLLYYSVLSAMFLKAKIPFFQNTTTRRKSFTRKVKKSTAPGVSAARVIKEIEPLFPGKQNERELLFALQSKLKMCPQRDEPGFREIINEFIVSESENKCSILLSEDDLNIVWL